MENLMILFFKHQGYTPEIEHGTKKSTQVKRKIIFHPPPFSGSMFNFRGVQQFAGNQNFPGSHWIPFKHVFQMRRDNMFLQHLWSCSYIPPQQKTTKNKKCKKKIIYIYIFISHLHKDLWSNFPKSKKHLHLQIQDSKGSAEKNTGALGLTFFSTKTHHSRRATWNQDPIYVAGTFSFMMEASPDQATLPAVSLGGNPWFETKATGGFFGCCGCVGRCRMCFFLAHECHHRLRGNNFWCQLVCGVGGVGVWSRMFILIYWLKQPVPFFWWQLWISQSHFHPGKLTLRRFCILEDAFPFLWDDVQVLYQFSEVCVCVCVVDLNHLPCVGGGGEKPPSNKKSPFDRRIP